MTPPPAFSHVGDLPGNRFLAGIKSKEVQGERYNQLRLDDTPGQISAQLATEHGHSQLNLGCLTHPRSNGEGQSRGEGAELRSDQSVVVRAARLMLLTTQAMLGAGKLEIQAQQDSIGIAADRDVNISASQGEVMIVAKKSIMLSCGGAYIKIADGKIEHGCAGDFIVKAGMHKWDGPAHHEAKLPFFPSAEHINWLKLDLDGYQGAPMAGVPYTLHFADGQQKDGTLDANGMAEERNLPDTITKVIYHNAPSAKDEARPVATDLFTALEPLIAEEPNMVEAPLGQGEW